MTKECINRGLVIAALAGLTGCALEDNLHYHHRRAVEQRAAEAAANDQRGGAILGGAAGPEDSGYASECGEADREQVACSHSGDYYYDSEGRRHYYRERY